MNIACSKYLLSKQSRLWTREQQQRAELLLSGIRLYKKRINYHLNWEMYLEYVPAKNRYSKGLLCGIIMCSYPNYHPLKRLPNTLSGYIELLQ